MKDFFLSVSAISVILAGVWLVIPKGSMQKPLKYSVGIFAIAAIISAVFKIKLTLPEEKVEYDESTLSYDIETVIAQTAIETVLENNNIPVEKVTVYTDISENGSINITKVILLPENTEDAERAKEILIKETGIIAECE